MKKKSVVASLLVLIMCFACMTGCGQSPSVDKGVELASGGVLVLRVNPEIAVEYDEDGHVTAISARNDDAMNIIASCKGLIGQETREAVTTLVSAIGEAGYFVEEIEGEGRQITIEIEAGSSLPHDSFLDEVVADIRDCVKENNWNVPMDIENESDYGLTDYIDTDYGPGNDGHTDYGTGNHGAGNYNDGRSNYDDGNSPYEVQVVMIPPLNYGNSDYGEGNTDYDDGKSDYDNGNTDYDDGNSNYDDGKSDYGDANTDYDDGISDYDDGNSGYTAPAAPAAAAPVISYGNSDYSGGGDSGYGGGGGDSGYGGGGSDYGDSDYD